MKHAKHYDRNKTAANRFAAINKLMAAKVEKEPVTDEYAAVLEIRAYTALDAITRGHGGKPQWDLIARCLNQAWLFAKGGLGAEVKDVLDASHEAMRRMIPHFDRTGQVAFACEIDRKKVEEALSLWGAQLRMANIGEVDVATQIIEREYWAHVERRVA
jgi:hypothetical protein